MSNINIKEDLEVFKIAFRFKIFNFIIISEFNDEMEILTFNPFLQTTPAIYKINSSIPTTDNAFPCKLNDLYGYSYQVLTYHQPPRLFNGITIIIGIDVIFMRVIAQKQNAKIQHKVIIVNPLTFDRTFMFLMQNNVVDFTLNTATEFTIGGQARLTEVNTYDENGYCAMIPNPPRTSFLEFILTPFDTPTWICMILSIGVCCLLWALFNSFGSGNNSSSAGYFIFGVIANFIGQAIPFRTNRIIQGIIWQICIFMTFILGNAYQSLVISLMSESRNGTRLRSFDDLFASNFSSIVDPIFYNILNSSADHQSFTSNMMQAATVFDELDFEMLSLNNTAFIMRCDSAIAFFYQKRFQKLNNNVNEFFYMLPDKMHPFYEKFQVSKNCPFKEFLKQKTLTIFESGIRQHWRNKLEFRGSRSSVEENNLNNEKYLLSMEDFHGVFYILIFGLILASITLTLEIFIHDCVLNLNLSEMCLGFQRLLLSLGKKKKQQQQKVQVSQMQVRRIQVIPATSTINNEDQV